MSEWKRLIEPRSTVWAGLVGYAQERISELTQVCVSPESTDIQIRMAQAGIDELRRLQSVPDQLRATAEQSQRKPSRGEY